MFKNKKYTHRKYIFPMFKNIYKEEFMTNTEPKQNIYFLYSNMIYTF